MSDNKIFYAVIIDHRRFVSDANDNQLIAIFKHKPHAERYCKSMWKKDYTIKQINTFTSKELHDL
jgi:hypothetical protein